MAAAVAATARRRALQPLRSALLAVGEALSPRAVLAISGGPDSRALLETWPGTFATGVAHVDAVVVVVDHQQRPGSADEALAVVARARALGLSGRVMTVHPPRGDEGTLRRLRYAALRQVAADVGAAAIVTAHHEGDVAEGVLMHLAGVGGGRRGRAPLPVERRSDGPALVRPFLGLKKSTLRAALDALGVSDVVVDADDAVGKNARARLRLSLLALLGDERPAIETALARHGRLLREDDDVLDTLVPDADVVAAALAPALLRRWLRRQIAALGDDPRTAAAAIDDVIRLAAARSDAAVSVRGGTVQIQGHGDGRLVAVIPSAGQSQGPHGSSAPPSAVPADREKTPSARADEEP